MDALVLIIIIQAFVSNKANPLTDGICVEGIKRAGRSLYRSYKNGDKSAREDMCVASLFSGFALANAKLGAVHGLAAPLGGMISAPHGMLCARLLPFVVEANITTLERADSSSEYLKRFDTIAQLLIDDDNAKAMDGVIWIKRVCADMNIRSLKEFGLNEKLIPEIVRQAKKSSSIKGNPVELTEDKLTQILQQSL